MGSLFDWSPTAGSNTTCDGINCNTGMPVGNTDNLFRSMMAIIRQTFSSTLQNFLAGVSALPISSGGTGGSTAADARTALSAAKLGANNDITALTGLTTALAAAYGGTGQATPVFALTGNASAGTIAMSVNGSTVFKITWKDVTIAQNGTTAVTYHSAFSSWSRAWVNCGLQDTGATDNPPFVVPGSESTTGCTVHSALNSNQSGTVFAFGV